MLEIPAATLGDHFVLNGLVRHFAELQPVKLYARPELDTIIREMYCKTPNIIVSNDSPTSTIDIYFDNQVPVLWDEQFYTYYQVPFSYRYSKFRVDLISKPLGPSTKDPYCVVANKMRSADLTVPIEIPTTLPLIYLTEELSPNPLNFIPLLLNASEIHVVPSSIFCLADSLRLKAKLYYHDLRSDTKMRINNRFNPNKWNIIPYDRKI